MTKQNQQNDYDIYNTMKPDAKKHYNPSPEYFKELLDSTGMTQEAVAAQLGCTSRSLRFYLSGERRIPYRVQFALECIVLEP